MESIDALVVSMLFLCCEGCDLEMRGIVRGRLLYLRG